LYLLAVAAPSVAGEEWETSLGAGALYAPDYLGSDDYETRALPILRLSYGDRFYFNLTFAMGWAGMLFAKVIGGSHPSLAIQQGVTMIMIFNYWKRLMAAPLSVYALPALIMPGPTAPPHRHPLPAT